MPVFQTTQTFPRALAEVFEFFCQPAHLLRVAPPDLNMRLIEAPPRLQLGARVVVQGQRWGVPQRIVSEVTRFTPDVAITQEQRDGPFRRWVHTHRFEVVPGGTLVLDHVEFEPPGGILGLVITAAAVERDLAWLFGYRREQLQLLLGDRPG
jgi:ligand-binding SRPBCC domain-containing protein